MIFRYIATDDIQPKIYTFFVSGTTHLTFTGLSELWVIESILRSKTVDMVEKTYKFQGNTQFST